MVMISTIFNTVLLNPIFNFMVLLYRTTGNLGITIIAFTLITRVAMLPITIPQIKMTKKQRNLQPELDKIKKKFKHDKKKLAEEQMALFRKHKISPSTGCITTIITIILMLAIYRSVSTLTTITDVSVINNKVYSENMRFASDEFINTSFLYLDLAKPDPYLVVTLLAVALQFLYTKMLMPVTKATDKAVKKTPGQSDDIMQSMQKQNMYIMPFMFLIFGLTLPSGVIIYITTSTLIQFAQTVYFNGLGGLEPMLKKLKLIKG